MPKENTHLYFLDKVAQEIYEPEIKQLIEKHKDFFYLGSVAPDTFYYLKKTEPISDWFHGRDGNKTNIIILDWLERAKQAQDERAFIFVCGYLTHCALDIFFHPTICELSGDYHDPNPIKRRRAVYLHRYLETVLDANLKHSFDFKTFIKWPKAKNLKPIFLALQARFNLTEDLFFKAFKNQFQKNLLFKSQRMFYLAYWLNKLHLADLEQELGLFYGNLKNNSFVFDEKFKQQDLKRYFAQAENYAKIMIAGALDFYKNRINLEQLAQIIKGENLNSGL